MPAQIKEAMASCGMRNAVIQKNPNPEGSQSDYILHFDSSEARNHDCVQSWLHSNGYRQVLAAQQSDLATNFQPMAKIPRDAPPPPRVNTDWLRNAD
jgi:hypothetical protein